ncbi:RIP metalloprotease RseP [Hymenobacter sp. YC55]|uniref:RIP metalloprotease RseP n=1 Tax=Hymenobacter sp. YC55 TaxID=3034019 RepID=UPI0023F7C2B6|nr:RIP metalloprotease RseP [Hymenobacter sp. YC55]MDF7815323.1 RIP metalloprotease RseP [Hymenobacter sp. YC55]
MEILIMASQLVLGLSLLVGLHELGHFGFAKLFGIRVHKFYIFFDFLFPISSKRTFALFKKKVGETEYGIGWLPLGGYVQIHGMVDETQIGTALEGPSHSDEFRSKPAWQRLLVMAGGIGVNLITGIVIFAALVYTYGVEYLPADAVPGGVLTSSLGREVGLRDGDHVVGMNGRPLVEFDQLYDPEMLSLPGTYLTVVRQGKRLDLPPFPASFFGQLAAAGDSAYVQPRKPFIIGEVNAGDSAAAGGLLVGDRIRFVNEVPIAYFDEMARELDRFRGQRVRLRVERVGQLVALQVGVKPDGKIGLRATFELPTQTHHYSLAEALPQGADQAATVLRLQALGISKMLRREVSATDSMAGPVEIAQQFGGVWDWHHFWSLVAQLSMVLAFMNLLPIPGLDGGHIVFLLYEMASGLKPAVWVLQRAQRVGALLLLSLMMYVLVVKQIMKLF